MADQEDCEPKMEDVVSEVTVKALKEFDTGEMEDVEKRPPSKTPSDRPGSRPASAKSPSNKGSRPSSAVADRPSSVASNRKGSDDKTATSTPGSKAGSRVGSRAGSRPGSATPRKSPSGSKDEADDKPASRPSSAKRSATGSKPASPDERLPSATDKPSSRPLSGAGRPASEVERPASGAGRPASEVGRPASGAGRPASEVGRPASGAGRPTSGADRPSSGVQRPSSKADRPASGVGRPPSGAGRSPSGAGRPPSGAGRSPSGAGRPSSRADRPLSGRPPLADVEQEQPAGEGDWAGEEQGTIDGIGPINPQTTVLEAVHGRGGGGGDSEGDGSDNDENDEAQDEDEDGQSEESDDENEMVVLDPDHPLMQRFQKALKAHLEKQNEKVSLELMELKEAVKNKKKTREDLGVELYGIQQELARHQMLLEKDHDEYSRLQQNRQQTEQKLAEIRNMYKENQLQVSLERKKGAELQAEVENLALRLFYMENAKEDVRSDISVMRRAAEKAESEVSKAELEKQKQDLFVDRLVERVDKLREEISLYEAQMIAQSEETKATKDALSEAYMEMEGINLEKKQLFQQWNSSLIGMRRRDEAHAAMLEALSQQKQRIMSLETEIDGYKRSIGKEQEQNEKLTLVLNKTEMDIATVRKMLQQCLDKHEALKNEYATYTRMLHETEQALNRANNDKTMKMNELNALRKQIEREYLEKVQLEDEIMEKMRTQMTMDKASKYTFKLTSKLRNVTKDLEAQVAQVENTISRDTLENSNIQTRIDRLNKILAVLDEEIHQKNEIINRSEAEIIKRNAVIERKQGIIDQYNKKLEQMISSSGGEEVGPLEIQINSLTKSIEAEQQEITELQQMWLRDQSELVRLSQEKEDQSRDVEVLKKQLTILSQKKVRVEGEINQQKADTSDIERSIGHMQNDMLKLNTLLHKEKGQEVNLQQANILMENDFVGALREAEMSSIEMQSQLDAIKEEKERLLNSLVEAERQIMLWEKKIQLAKETRAAVDSEIGLGEIRAMKAEIHRMTVRYGQLMKQQERMIQEMEKAVSRRDTIVTRGDAQSRTNKKVVTKGTFQRQMGELRKKVKSTIQDANSCDNEIQELRDHQATISHELEDHQVKVQQLQASADTLDGDIDRLFEQKQRNLQEILTRQQKVKYYQQVKDGKYTRLCKTNSALDNEMEKQGDRLQTLSAIVDRLNQEYPHVQPSLHKVTLGLQTRIGGEE